MHYPKINKAYIYTYVLFYSGSFFYKPTVYYIIPYQEAKIGPLIVLQKLQCL